MTAIERNRVIGMTEMRGIEIEIQIEIYKDQTRLDQTRLDQTIELREISIVIRLNIEQDTQEYIIESDL